MKNFTYYRPDDGRSRRSACSMPSGAPAELLAGGTDLLDLQKEYIAQPDKVVSLGGIEQELTEHQGRSQATGPIVHRRRRQAGRHRRARQIAQALPGAGRRRPATIGGPQIRNMGTLGGNLCQRNRCWYFRDEHVHCLLKGGDKCFALDGENRYHAIFTQGHQCVIVNPSTLAPVLIALGATAEVLGPQGQAHRRAGQVLPAPQLGRASASTSWRPTRWCCR